jgi:hypothetical protein
LGLRLHLRLGRPWRSAEQEKLCGRRPDDPNQQRNRNRQHDQGAGFGE